VRRSALPCYLMQAEMTATSNVCIFIAVSSCSPPFFATFTQLLMLAVYCSGQGAGHLTSPGSQITEHPSEGGPRERRDSRQTIGAANGMKRGHGGRLVGMRNHQMERTGLDTSRCRKHKFVVHHNNNIHFGRESCNLTNMILDYKHHEQYRIIQVW
jgi:hypothetical protein